MAIVSASVAPLECSLLEVFAAGGTAFADCTGALRGPPVP
jgi:hypothetical protein